METVVFPLSEETGQQILATLRRIARALESSGGESTQRVLVEDDVLVLGGATVEDGVLSVTGTVEDDILVL